VGRGYGVRRKPEFHNLLVDWLTKTLYEGFHSATGP
jgi:hypothetical protein